MAKVILIPESNLIFGQLPKSNRFKDLSGRRFERLIVLGFSGVIDRHGQWYCKCDCGNLIVTSTGSLNAGSCVSCGCFKREKLARKNTTHGLSHTRTYRAWEAMKRRCLSEKCEQYHNYGGRGITFCERWNDFKNFLADMGKCPKGLTLERNDTNGNYEKLNCRWATIKEQQNNRRNNNLLTFGGKTLSVTQWENELGFKKGVISQRINKYKWPIKKSLTTPSRIK